MALQLAFKSSPPIAGGGSADNRLKADGWIAASTLLLEKR
jgi:hypothetical protein